MTSLFLCKSGCPVKFCLLSKDFSFIFTLPKPVFSSVQYFHDLTAAAGDHLSGLDMQQLMADGAVDIAFLFRSDNGGKAAFQFVFHIVTSFFEIRAGVSPCPFLYYIIHSPWSIGLISVNFCLLSDRSLFLMDLKICRKEINIYHVRAAQLQFTNPCSSEDNLY